MRGAGLLARIGLAFVALPALGASGVFIEEASLGALPPPPGKEEREGDRTGGFRRLNAPHFVSPGRSTVILIRLDRAGTTNRGAILENGRVELLTIAIPPVTVAFESGLGDRVEMRYSDVSTAFWDSGCTMRNPSGRVAVRREGDRLQIEADVAGDADCVPKRGARAMEIACKVRGYVDRLDRTSLTPRYGLAVPYEEWGRVLLPRDDAEHGSVSLNCVDRKPQIPESQAAMERAEDRALASRKRHLGYYDSRLDPFFFEKVMARCVSKRAPEGARLQVGITLDENGRASEVIAQPDAPRVRCLEETILKTDFPKPPESPFYFHADIKGGR